MQCREMSEGAKVHLQMFSGWPTHPVGLDGPYPGTAKLKKVTKEIKDYIIF